MFRHSQYCRELLRIANLTDIERKMGLYKSMFYTSSGDDTTPNFIKVDALQIDLMAGGLSWDQQAYVIKKLEPNEYREVSMDGEYMTYGKSGLNGIVRNRSLGQTCSIYK